MAAYAGKKEIMRLIAPSGKVYQAGTYSGNPVSVTAGLATLKILRSRKNLYTELEKKCSKLTKSLERSSEDLGVKTRVNRVASMFQMFLTGEPVRDYASAKTADNKKFMEFHRKLLKNGVFLPPSQFETCFISSAHSETDLKKTADAIEACLQQVA